MSLLIDLISSIEEARAQRDSGAITHEQCESRIDSAHQDFKAKEQAAWESQSKDIEQQMLQYLIPAPGSPPRQSISKPTDGPDGYTCPDCNGVVMYVGGHNETFDCPRCLGCGYLEEKPELDDKTPYDEGSSNWDGSDWI